MRAVKNLEQMIATQATKLAALAWLRHQFDASIAGMALGADHIGRSHVQETIIFNR
jgi:hypothetical protein